MHFWSTELESKGGNGIVVKDKDNHNYPCTNTNLGLEKWMLNTFIYNKSSKLSLMARYVSLSNSLCICSSFEHER